ncbi:MAG: N-acetylmuramoyl-L-alanine amidase [Holosporales bacterium]|nr:N-acetylmuramoyl-L-alanine amidase [Holosporales bacterium]
MPPKVRIIWAHLDNKDCTSERGEMYYSWEEMYTKSGLKPEANRPIKFIILHYTVTRDFYHTVGAFRSRGVSTHYVIGPGGEIYMTLDPRTAAGRHCGASAWMDLSNLNPYSIGIEHIGPGVVGQFEKIPGFGAPRQVRGSNLFWFPFSEKQFLSSMMLIMFLAKKYQIPPWNIISHHDIAVGRKVDIGPLWDYERAHREFGVGYFPAETHLINLDHFNELTDDDYIALVEVIGYHLPDKSIIESEMLGLPGETIEAAARRLMLQAYQMHFSRGNISGTLNDPTKIAILQHVIDLAEYVDPLTGKKHDEFRARFMQWKIDNPGKAQAFRGY